MSPAFFQLCHFLRTAEQSPTVHRALIMCSNTRQSQIADSIKLRLIPKTEDPRLVEHRQLCTVQLDFSEQLGDVPDYQKSAGKRTNETTMSEHFFEGVDGPGSCSLRNKPR